MIKSNDWIARIVHHNTGSYRWLLRLIAHAIHY
jgi:hypothetical protein